MKKFFTTLFLSAAVAVQAQYLPNSGFDSWKTACGSTEAFGTGGMTSSKTGEMRQRPGVEPADWNGSSINQKVIMQKQQELIYNENGAVKMVNTFVGVGSIGSVAPGFINLATPWVYAVSTISDCDGGVYGGVSFTYKPDAIKGRYKRTDATGENSHIIVYLWNGTFTSNVGSKSAPSQARDNVDRAIMGIDGNTTASGTLVAKCDYTFTTTDGEWKEITVPIEYVSDEAPAPAMMNTIISGGDYWTRANMQDGTTLYADDVQFVYYSELASLVYGGVNYLKSGVTSYLIKGEYDPSKLSLTSNGKGATIETSFNEYYNILTITVKGNDYSANPNNCHEYKVMFIKEGYYRIEDATGAYLDMTGKSAGEALALSTDGNSAGTIFYYDGNGKLLNYKAGQYTYNTNLVAPVDATSVSYWTMAAGDGALVMRDSNSSVGKFLHSDGSAVTGCSSACSQEHGFLFCVAESLPISISEAGYTAFYAPVAVEMPAGVTAHTVTINGDWATLSDPLEVVPAYTGVVIAGPAGEYDLPIVETFEVVDDNALLGTIAADYVKGDAYVLSKPAGKEIGFYRATLNKLDGTAFYLSSHKAYLPASAAQGSAFYGLRIGGTTGITEVETAPAEDVIYDLTGRRVTKIVAPGIYIVNGVKKFFN